MENRPPSLSALFTILYSPRKTIRRIVDANPKYQVTRLAAFTGWGSLLGMLSSYQAGNVLPLLVILVIGLIGGPILGLIVLYLVGKFLYLTGKSLGGEASELEVRAAYAWASVPNLWLLPVWLPRFMLYGRTLFTRTIAVNPDLWLVSQVFYGIGLIGSIWVFVLELICVSEVHRFSIWRALLTIILSLVMVVMVMLLFYCIGLIGMVVLGLTSGG